MGRLIDAYNLYREIVKKGQASKRYKVGEYWELNGAEIWKVIETQPTVDAIEVVRCKDCKHRPHIEKAITRYRQEIEVCAPMVDGREDYSCMCLNPDNSYFSWMPDDDWFCADGERREADG